MFLEWGICLLGEPDAGGRVRVACAIHVEDVTYRTKYEYDNECQDDVLPVLHGS